MKSASSLDCDIVIVNYNSGPLLAECLLSVASLGVANTIIVDNASADNSLELDGKLALDEKITIVHNARNIGFSTACNIGARVSRAGHMLFLNPDCTLAPGALERLIEVLDSSEKVGMVGGFLCNPDGSEQPGGRRVIPTPRRAFVRAFGLSFLAKKIPKYFSDFLLHLEPLPSESVSVEAISGACMLVKREAVEGVGLWDESYFLHCEDLDWCMRFRQKGYQILFVPDAKVFHVHGGCSRSRPIFVEWHKHRGMLRFYGKFFRDQYPGVLWLLVMTGVWLRFALVAGYYGVRSAGRAVGTGRG
jgi:hypothetical protein